MCSIVQEARAAAPPIPVGIGVGNWVQKDPRALGKDAPGKELLHNTGGQRWTFPIGHYVFADIFEGLHMRARFAESVELSYTGETLWFPSSFLPWLLPHMVGGSRAKKLGGLSRPQRLRRHRPPDASNLP